METPNTHFLYPATLFAHPDPHRVYTILGSCVAVCLFDPILRIGGMNHFMLPLWNGQGLASPKYGNIAIEKLIALMLGLGSLKQHLRAKVFGGGEVIETRNAQLNIGQRNIQIAMAMLGEARIPVLAQSIGGKMGRRLELLTHTGEVKQRYLERWRAEVKEGFRL